MDNLDLEVQLLFEPDQRDHDFRFHFHAGLLHFGCGFEHRARLHLGNFRIDQTQPATAETEHRVELVQLVDAFGNLIHAQAELLGQEVLRAVIVRQEFVQWRIEEPDRGWPPIQHLEDADEVRFLVGQQLRQRVLPIFDFLG